MENSDYFFVTCHSEAIDWIAKNLFKMKFIVYFVLLTFIGAVLADPLPQEEEAGDPLDWYYLDKNSTNSFNNDEYNYNYNDGFNNDINYNDVRHENSNNGRGLFGGIVDDLSHVLNSIVGGGKRDDFWNELSIFRNETINWTRMSIDTDCAELREG